MGGSFRSLAIAATVWLAALVSAGCAERRDLPLKPAPERVTYEGTIQPIFEQRCVSCHGTNNPPANYAMTTYAEVLGNGSDGIPNAIPGDPQSLLLLKSLPGGSMNGFYSGPEEVALVEQWVVEDSLAIR
jgi:hypothetical protein